MKLPPVDTLARYEASGNDYIVLVPDAVSFALGARAVETLCDRHHGIGSDGVLALAPSSRAAYGMRVFNPDGGEAEFSGNGVRIFARFARDVLGERRTAFAVETPAGVTAVAMLADRDGVPWVEATVAGSGIVDPDRTRRTLRLDGDREVTGYAVSVGNPHFVVFEEDARGVALGDLGAALQRHPSFPQGVNVELVAPGGAGEIGLRMWERGVGETLSSGSCACAAVLICRALLDPAGSRTMVRMRGGHLEVETAGDSSISLRGPIRELIRGRIGADLVARCAKLCPVSS